MKNQSTIETETRGGSCAPVTGSAPALNREQIAILDHTEHRAARGLYCGGGKDMDALVALGLMESAGRAAWCPDEYFRITGKGRTALRQAPNTRLSGTPSAPTTS